MKKILILFVASLFLLISMVVPVAGASEERTPTTRDLKDYLTIHYDFEGSNINSQFADKATAGSSNDKLAFDGKTDDALNYYTVADGVITTTGVCDIVPVATEGLPDLLASNVGTGTWFIRCKATAATTLIDFRHCAQQTTQNRVFYLALNEAGNIVIEAKSGAAGATHKQTAVTYFTYDYASAPWLNLAAVRRLVDGKYYYYLYVSTGDAPLAPLTTNGSWQVRFDFGATEESGLASAEDINLGIFQQSFTVWKTTKGVSIDDVRYYNTDLTTEELATVVGEILDASEPATPPADTDEPSTDTNEPPVPDTSEPSGSTEDSSQEPLESETVDPNSGGTPTVPKLPETTTEVSVETVTPFFEDDLDVTGEPADGEASGGCGAVFDGGMGMLLLLALALLSVQKTKKSRSCDNAILDQ